MDYVSPRVQKQIKEYKKNYNFTYSGMLKALIYFFEVKQNPIEKANGGIGILPYIYKEAYDYYYSIYLANNKNKSKDLSTYKIKTKESTIQKPERAVKKRNLFSFLDEEEIDINEFEIY